MGVKKNRIYIFTHVFTVCLLSFTASFAKCESFFRINENFFNAKEKLSGKNISSLYYVLIEKNEKGEFFINEKINFSGQEKCHLKKIPSQKLKYDAQVQLGKGLIIPQNVEMLKKYLFRISRVDTIFLLESESSISVHIWGTSGDVLKRQSADSPLKPSLTLEKFCDRLGYNGIVVDVSGSTVSVVTAPSNIEAGSQAAVYGKQANQIYIKEGGIGEASAVLQFNKKKKNVILFDKLVGEVRIWDKVLVTNKAVSNSEE